MAHVKRGVTGKARHRKITKMAKGYRGRAKNCFRVAVEKVEKGLRYSYRDRRLKKRNYRSLWIQRINAGAREHGLTYSQLIGGLNKAGVTLDRKALSEIAIHDATAFASLAKQAKDAMQKAAA